MSGCTVCLMARAPELGQVKTRLAAQLGDEAALDAYQALLRHKLAQLSRLEMPVELWMTGPEKRCRAVASGVKLPLQMQCEGDLGVRMLHIAEHVSKRGGIALVTGVDLPELDAEVLRAAAGAIEDHDVVLVPTEDGGYGLIGMRSPHPRLFEGLSWGGATVCRDTQARAREQGFSTALLPVTWDVDDVPGLERFRRLRGQSPGCD